MTYKQLFIAAGIVVALTIGLFTIIAVACDPIIDPTTK